MRKQSVIIALAVGLLLAGFQNCSPAMKAEQAIENAEFERSRKMPELDQEPSVEIQSALKTYCPSSTQKFDWPFGGVAHRDWVIENYFDSDPTAGLKDYSGAVGSKALTYDGHAGIDIDVPSFRSMDQGFPVLAAAAGKVVNIYEGSADRNLACSTDQWNFVKIRHASGIASIYGHLKKDSVVVNIGDMVVAGQKIGVVGSSGCSYYPHLHFQVKDCNDKNLDPMAENMFNAPPLYSRLAPTTLMDIAVLPSIITNISTMADPGNNMNAVAAHADVGLGITVANLKTNDVLVVKLIRPDGTLDPNKPVIKAVRGFSLSHWYWNTYFEIRGDWSIRYFINGVEFRRHKLTVQ